MATPIKDLGLYVRITFSELESVLRAANISRFETVKLRLNGSSKDADSIINHLTNARNLRKLVLRNSALTREQIERMKERGVELIDDVFLS